MLETNDITSFGRNSDIKITKNRFHFKTKKIFFGENIDVNQIGWSIIHLPNLSHIVFSSQFQFDCFNHRFSEIKAFVNVPINVYFENNRFVLSSNYDDNSKINIWNDFEYILNKEGNVIITKYHGRSEELEIPNMLNGKKVIGIEAGSFKQNETIKRLMIDGIEIFDGDNYLGGSFEQTKISFASIKNICRIGRKSFYQSSIKELLLENIEFISNESFKECCNLKMIFLSNPTNGIKTLIGRSAFEECSDLKGFNGLNNDNICYIENYSFFNCFQLEIGNVYEFSKYHEFDIPEEANENKNESEVHIYKYIHCLHYIFGLEYINIVDKEDRIISCSKFEYDMLKSKYYPTKIIKINILNEESIHIIGESFDERYFRLYKINEYDVKRKFTFNFEKIPGNAKLSRVSNNLLENKKMKNKSLKNEDKYLLIPGTVFYNGINKAVVIGKHAFSGMKDLFIDLRYINEINETSFQYCRNLNIKDGNLGNIKILPFFIFSDTKFSVNMAPLDLSNIVKIGKCAFAGSSNLNLKDGKLGYVNYLPYGVFYETKFSTIMAPLDLSNIDEITKDTFVRCKNVNIKNGNLGNIKMLPEFVFSEAKFSKHMAQLDLSNIDHIGENAFNHCKNLNVKDNGFEKINSSKTVKNNCALL